MALIFIKDTVYINPRNIQYIQGYVRKDKKIKDDKDVFCRSSACIAIRWYNGVNINILITEENVSLEQENKLMFKMLKTINKKLSNYKSKNNKPSSKVK